MDKKRKDRTEYAKEYNKEHYERISIFFKPGEREKVKDYAAGRGESVNAFIKRAIMEAMKNG